MSRILYPNQADYIKSFRKNDDPLLAEMEEYAAQNNIPILSWDAAVFMEQLILMTSPKRVLEIGTAIAYTTIRIAKHLRKKAVVHTIEKSQNNAALAREFISRSGVEEKITLFEGEAFDIFPGLKKKYDLIFLDADKEDYKKLFDYSMILLKRGGLIFVDNLLWHGYAASLKVPAAYKVSTKHIRNFNIDFMNQPNLKSTILPIGDGIGLGIKARR